MNNGRRYLKIVINNNVMGEDPKMGTGKRKLTRNTLYEILENIIKLRGENESNRVMDEEGKFIVSN